jgi:hypothetical protein
MTGYTKLFGSILGSTIWREDPATKVVWVTMMAMADQDGIVEASIPGLASMANVTVEQTETAIRKFLAPDKYSRTPDHDGRRIEEIDGGWRLLNYEKYREKLSQEEIKSRAAARQQRYRDRHRNESVTVTPALRSVTPSNAESRYTYTDTYTETNNPPPDAEFDGSVWALQTFKAYPTWGNPDALVAPARLSEIYLETVEREAPARGGMLKAAEWLLAVTQEFARQSVDVERRYLMQLEKFLRQGYAEVKMPARGTTKFIPKQSDEAEELRLREEARARRRQAVQEVAAP